MSKKAGAYLTHKSDMITKNFTAENGTDYTIIYDNDSPGNSLEITRKEITGNSVMSFYAEGDEALESYLYLMDFPEEDWAEIIEKDLNNNVEDKPWFKEQRAEVYRSYFNRILYT
jgi:hypothetical protein